MSDRKRKIWGIDVDVIDMVNESAQSSLPNEFVAMLRAEMGVITEILLLPGTFVNYHSATIQLYMLPIDLSVIGTIHSHPGPSNHWSQADLDLFGRFGNTHIITCLPFDRKSWQAYDYKGDPVQLELIY